MCLHQDRGKRMRQMDSLTPTLADPYKQGRMTWAEQGKGVVQLGGFVRSQADITQAVRVARGVTGVKSVNNDRRIK